MASNNWWGQLSPREQLHYKIHLGMGVSIATCVYEYRRLGAAYRAKNERFKYIFNRIMVKVEEQGLDKNAVFDQFDLIALTEMRAEGEQPAP